MELNQLIVSNLRWIENDDFNSAQIAEIEDWQKTSDTRATAIEAAADNSAAKVATDMAELTKSIDAESAARATADIALDNRVNTANAALETAEESLEKAIETNHGAIGDNANAIASEKDGTIDATRSISAIRVPRPGPSSTRLMVVGWPICCQTTPAHRPMSSPNI